MPPTEAPTQTTDAMPGEMAAPTPDMAPQGGGTVSLEMSAVDFDSIYSAVSQFKSTLDALKADVDSQKGSANPEMAPENTEAPMPPEGAGTDEDFLKSIAEQGSVR